ncbi:hypothetical protein BVY02_00435 [bacterium J17]|nr:hypothetical protein BVY02_00435 [bacterium J17]
MPDEVSKCVDIESNGQVLTLIIDRPKALNALSGDVLQEISQHLSEIQQKLSRGDDYRVLFVRGAGEKAFVAGADIKVMQGGDKSQVEKFIELGQSVMNDIEQLPLAVVAVVDGFAIGGGLELALACDLILATEAAKVGQAEVNLGIIPGFGGTQRLANRVGVGAAKRLIFTGETISSEEANRMGMFDWLVPAVELDSKISEISALICSKGPLAVAASKRAINAKYQESQSSGLKREISEFIDVFSSSDAKEGLTAFVEKRAPSFRRK